MNVDLNNDSALVSVIIPCYNAEKSIKKTLESLENQSYKNFEVMLINDGSTDKSDLVISEYLKKSKLNCRYIKQQNKGVSKARNMGIKNSKGKYITFLDSDDLYHERYIEDLLNTIENKIVDTVFCSYTRDLIYKDRSKNKIKSSIKYLKHNELMKFFMYRIGPCGFFNFIYKKSIIEEFNIYFDESTKYGEDLEFSWKYLTHCNNGIFINKPLYIYIDNPNSAVNNISWEITDVLHAIKRSEKYICKNEDSFSHQMCEYMYDRTIWAVCKSFAKAKNIALFNRFINEYDVRKSMKQMVKKSPNIIIKISSVIFLINHKLFYNLVKI